MNANPDLKRRILQQLDPANQFDGGMTGHDGMIVIGVRGAKKGDQAVTPLFADDPAAAPDRGTHGDQGRLQSRNRSLGIKFRDQISRTLQIGTEDGEVFALTGDTAANFRSLRLYGMLRGDRPAGRTKKIACLQDRSTDLTRHPQLLHPPVQINETSWRNKAFGTVYGRRRRCLRVAAIGDTEDWTKILGE